MLFIYGLLGVSFTQNTLYVVRILLFVFKLYFFKKLIVNFDNKKYKKYIYFFIFFNIISLTFLSMVKLGLISHITTQSKSVFILGWSPWLITVRGPDFFNITQFINYWSPAINELEQKGRLVQKAANDVVKAHKPCHIYPNWNPVIHVYDRCVSDYNSYLNTIMYHINNSSIQGNRDFDKSAILTAIINSPSKEWMSRSESSVRGLWVDGHNITRPRYRI